RQSVISARKDKKFLVPMCFEGACDGPIQYLIETRVATKFDSGATRKLVESYGCEIIFLPPYSPDLNPIEKYWANMRTKIRELLPTVATLSEDLDAAILSMSI